MEEHNTPEVYPRDQHSISRSSIDPDALKIMRRLIRFGHKGYLVGGGVRDLLLGREPKDFDIATDATPRKIKTLFRNCRIIGKRFKLAHIYFRGGKIIEVATFRQMTESIMKESETEAVTTLAKDNTYGDEHSDALRRDLTINGLFYDLASFSVIDYVGGVRDLRSDLVRIIGDPPTRYLEDPVRMLRVARHAGRLGFSVDRQTSEPIANSTDLLLNVAPVRIYEEIKKDLCSGYFLPILELFDSLGLLQALLPNLATMNNPFWKNASSQRLNLELMDEEYRVSNLKNVSLALGIMILSYVYSQNETEYFSDYVSSRETIDSLVKEVFTGVLIPRREKEKLIDLLLMTLSFENQGAKSLQSKINPATINTLLRLLEVTKHPLLTADEKDVLLSLKNRKKSNRRRNYRKKRGFRI